MSIFSVPVRRIRAIEPHPNADAIEFAVIDGYRSIVRKGEFERGELVVYIPEAALIPEWLLRRLNLWDANKSCGKLAGKAGNRVKAIRLRGELSQGLCYPVIQDRYDGGQIVTGDEDGCFANVREGDDAAGLLGIEKYEPPIPVALSGEVFNAGQHLTIAFDIENWKSWPDIFRDGEEVVFTEKLHGTFTGVAVLPLTDSHPEAFGVRRNVLIFSKSLGADGLVFKHNARNHDNVYVRATRKFIEAIDAKGESLTEPVIFMGETFGPDVQDLPYGKEIGFRLFAIARGYRGAQQFLDFNDMLAIAASLDVEVVPVLYRGPFSQDVMCRHTDGQTTLGGGHIREGIVMTPVVERRDPQIGRVCLKSVSAAYLTRKGGTEYR